MNVYGGKGKSLKIIVILRRSGDTVFPWEHLNRTFLFLISDPFEIWLTEDEFYYITCNSDIFSQVMCELESIVHYQVFGGNSPNSE